MATQQKSLDNCALQEWQWLYSLLHGQKHLYYKEEKIAPVTSFQHCFVCYRRLLRINWTQNTNEQILEKMGRKERLLKPSTEGKCKLLVTSLELRTLVLIFYGAGLQQNLVQTKMYCIGIKTKLYLINLPQTGSGIEYLDQSKHLLCRPNFEPGKMLLAKSNSHSLEPGICISIYSTYRQEVDDLA